MPFSALLGDPGSLTVLNFLRSPASPIYEYLHLLQVTECTLVVRVNPNAMHNPNHRDKLTGSNTFKRVRRERVS